MDFWIHDGFSDLDSQWILKIMFKKDICISLPTFCQEYMLFFCLPLSSQPGAGGAGGSGGWGAEEV